ncbi:MAG: aspartate ammonia-lyase, partial [Psychrobium sp.]|nr:aspartate ammonia-lyase [Psychrobium sp.]
MTNFRIEKDSMGELNVPSSALYGAQTQRAVNNFPISSQLMPKSFICALIKIKAAAAKTNKALGAIKPEIADAIVAATETLLNDKDLMSHFPVDVYQTGSGTSTNMNANEVLAHIASKESGLTVSPNDHVNCGQSSNDVIPSTIHVSAALELDNKLLPALNHLVHAIDTKAEAIKHHIKTGRTHLMDAMPVTMAQSLYSWSSQISQNITNLQAMQPVIQTLAQGGRAVGTG